MIQWKWQIVEIVIEAIIDGRTLWLTTIVRRGVWRFVGYRLVVSLSHFSSLIVIHFTAQLSSRLFEK